MKKVFLEIACFNEESAIKAFLCGAHRIEICEDMFVGGKTPSNATIESIIEHTGDVNRMVMIHKLGTSYNYTKRDFQWMLDRIGDLNEMDLHGYVFGAVNEKNLLDKEKLQELVTAAEGRPCTFHRAFDSIENKSEALEELIELGFKRVLTSGGEGRAIDNAQVLADLNKQAAGRIIILAGGGVRSVHAKVLIQKTGVFEIHSSAILKGELVDEEEVKRLLKN
ncbi:MAG: copper homeostasis protein CutC [Bacteroidota bacterium]|jgi:copper homeostasis protein